MFAKHLSQTSQTARFAGVRVPFDKPEASPARLRPVSVRVSATFAFFNFYVRAHLTRRTDITNRNGATGSSCRALRHLDSLCG